MIKPNFFIVGKPKCGTTTLHNLLGQHPEIFMSPEKEPHHFHRDYLEAAMKRRRGYKNLAYREREDYLALFAGSEEKEVVGEASVGYLYSKFAAQVIAKFNPQAKILMCFREPVNFLYSYHNHLCRSANENEPNFRKALDLEEARKQGTQIPSMTTFPDNLFYSEHVKYREQARRFFDVFPDAQIKVVIYEDFKADNLAVYRDILEFLGVDPEFTPQIEDINPTQTLRFPRIVFFLTYFGQKSPYAVARWMPAVVLRPIRFVLRKIFRREGALPELDDELRRELMARFKPEVEKLGEFLGIDLCRKWGYDR